MAISCDHEGLPVEELGYQHSHINLWPTSLSSLWEVQGGDGGANGGVEIVGLV